MSFSIAASVDSDRRYDAETLTLQVTVADVSTRSEIRVTIGDTTMAADPRMEDVFDILRHAEMRYLTKEQAYAAITENGIDALATMDSLEHVSGMGGFRRRRIHCNCNWLRRASCEV